jgi:hypothetical protein
MCIQCAATAAVAVGSATGIRAWLASGRRRLGPRALRFATVGLLAAAVVVSGIGLGGTG